MMKFPLLSITFVLLIAGCAVAQDVRYNFDRDADFSKFKTYKWVSLNTTTQGDSLLSKQIKAAVDIELGVKGLTKVEEDTADLSFYSERQSKPLPVSGLEPHGDRDLRWR